MSNISERLNNISEARKISEQEDRDVWREVEDKYPWAAEYRKGIGEAYNIHRKRLLALQEQGIFEMLREATGGVTLEIIAEPEKGKSGVNVVGDEGKNQGLYGEGWSIDVNKPCLERTINPDGEKEYSWNTDVMILVGQGIIDGKIFIPGSARYLTLEYSEDEKFTIKGEQVTFEGPIPKDEGQRAEVLEDAFVNAFAYPNVVMPQERLVQSR